MTEEKCPECFGFRGLPKILHDQDEPRECANDFHKSMAPIVEFPAPEIQQPEDVPAPSAMQQTVRKPICPYCGSDGKIFGSLTDLGPFKIMVVSCGNNDCRKFLGVFQPLGLEMVQTPGVTH